MPALQFAEKSEQGGNLAAGVLVDAVQAHERIEDQQARLQSGDGLGEVATVGFEIEPDGRRGDDLDIEVGQFHAWGDSNLYLRRTGDEIGLSVEHRAAPSPKPLTIELAQRGDALALEVADRREPVTPAPTSLDERIVAILTSADQPLPFAELRSQVRVRAATLLERIGVLCATGRIVKSSDGYRLART